LEELNEHLLVGADGWLATLEPYEWIAKAAPRAKIRSISSTVINMVYAIKAGHGASPLPSMMAAMEPDLVECFPLPQLKYFYFLATRESLKDVPRVKAFNDFVVSRAAAFKHVLLGRPAGEQ
jgi:DNA-binding transcriptional LysR family regulator